jgi:hypothetical protein
MATAIPLPLSKINAANLLHRYLDQWRLADQALELLAARCGGFEPDACLLKVAAVNTLYGTNLYAITRMAKHAAAVLMATDLAAAGPELVEQLAALPTMNGRLSKRRHYSFSSKFAHFFVCKERFPIMDSYAVAMLKRHLGSPIYRDDPTKRYVAFLRNSQQLKQSSGFRGSNRELDRYLWLAGEYAAWMKRPGMAINAELAALFERPPTAEVVALLGALRIQVAVPAHPH